MDPKIAIMYRVKKYLKILSLALFVFLIGIFIYEYIRIRPSNVYFTNTTSSSITVTWTTKTPIKGLAYVVESKAFSPISLFGLGRDKYYDTRDIKEAELLAALKTSENIATEDRVSISSNEIVTEVSITDMGKYYTHHIELRNLEPETEYEILVGDGMLFTKVADVNSESIVKTESIPEFVPSPVPAYGSIKNADNKDLPIEELLPVSDAVIYFNYFEELSEERSDVISGVLNEDGNWYLDVSMALDKDGEMFLAKYEESGPSNLYAELVIDAGPLGRWKKTVSIYESSPTEMIVLNTPNLNMDEGNTESLQKLNSLRDTSSVVKGVDAAESACVFISYCGCGKVVDYVWKDCDCDPATLEARKCTTQIPATQAVQEVSNSNPDQCAGGGELGATVMLGTACKTCVKSTSGTYLVWKDTPGVCTTGSPAGVVQNPTPTPTPTQPTTDTTTSNQAQIQVCIDNGGEWDKNQNKCVYQLKYEAKNNIRDRIIMDPVRDAQCLDLDGCTCLYQKYVIENVTNFKKEHNIDPSTWCPKTFSIPEKVEAPIVEDPKVEDPKVEVPKEQPVPQLTKGTICTVDGSRYPNNGRVDSNGNCIQNKEGNVCVLSFKDKQFGKFNQNGICADPGTCNGVWTKLGDSLICATQQTTYWTNAEKTLTVQEGEKCQLYGDYKSCSCLVGTYKSEYKGEMVEVPQYAKVYNNETCGKTPVETPQPVPTPQTTPSVPTPTPTPSPSSFFEWFSPIKKAYADDTRLDFKEYIIDTSNSSIAMLLPGEYIFEHQGDLYFLDVSLETVMATNGNISIYIDTNDNQKYDEGVDKKVSELGNILNVATINQSFTYQLQEGYNFVSLPFVTIESGQRTAAGLIEYLNEQFNDSVFSISRYDGSWKVVGQNTQVYDNNDFQLIPGQGYIIKAKRDVIISITGQSIIYEKQGDKAPILLSKGWNLIGIYGTNSKQYTAKTLIQDINSYSTVKLTADNVTRWESDVQRYDGYQLTNENGIDMEYGFDYPIRLLQSYFVRVQDGSGNWQPGLKE